MPVRFRAIHPVFHASKLATYTEPTIVGQKPTSPSPVITKAGEEWEVERILQHRKVGRGYQYLVRWKGFGREDDTWEPRKNLANAPEVLRKYEAEKAVEVNAQEEDSTIQILNRDSTMLVELVGG